MRVKGLTLKARRAVYAGMVKKPDDGKPELKRDTRLVTGGRDPFAYHGFVNPPVHHASTVLYRSAGDTLLPSGLAAISFAILSGASAGDHILVSDSVYEPTRILCNTVLKRLGIDTSFYDPLIAAGIATLFKPNTRLV